MFIISFYLAIGLVWTAHTAVRIGNFFDGEDAKDVLERIAAFTVSVIMWPVTLLIPLCKGFIEAYNEQKQGKV